jgi:peptidoglycan hydrolase-like protein with peptidoglycan-binding domain
MGAYSHDTCPAKVRGIQAFHMDRNGWNDIAYTTISCIHGTIFDCRGVNVRTAAQGTNEGNQISYAHCVMMGAGDVLTREAMQALHDIFGYYESQGSGTRHWCHSDWHPTGCPGDPIRAFVRSGLVVGGSPPPPPTPPPPQDNFRERIMAKPVLRNGSTGQDVRIMQALLMVAAHDLTGNDQARFCDGVFGAGTEKVLKEWQGRTHSLTADGVCGPATWAWLCGV